MITKDKGITLVALVITIIILIILAGITLNIVLGEDGLINKAKNGGEKYKNAANNELEILSNVNSFIDGKISSVITAPQSGGNDNPTEPSAPVDEYPGLTRLLSYTGDSVVYGTSNLTSLSNLSDLTGHGNNATLSNIPVSDDGKGLVFNTSTTGSINRSSTFDFPLTLEATIRCTDTHQNVLYFDSYTGVAIAFYGGYAMVTVGTQAQKVNLPSDFTDGNIKTITISYTSQTNFEVYVDGIQQTKSEETGKWVNSNRFYLGYSDGADHFKGTLYTLRVYNTTLDASAALASHNADMNMISNDTENANRNNLILEYVVKNDLSSYVDTLTDLAGNKDLTCYNLIYNSSTKGLIFNGTNSYAYAFNNSGFSYPLTLEATLSTNSTGSMILYLDTNTETAIGFTNGEFIFSNKSHTYKVPVPNDFRNGELKHLVIVYRSLDNYGDFDVYLNNTLLSKNSTTDFWSVSNTYFSLGRRATNPENYFKGTLYELNVFEGALTAEQVQNRYQIVSSKY